VELGAGGPGDLGDPALDDRMDVLVPGLERDRAVRELDAHLEERALDRLRLRVAEHSGREQAVHVRRRSEQVVLREPTVEGKACREGHQSLGRARAHSL